MNRWLEVTFRSFVPRIGKSSKSRGFIAFFPMRVAPEKAATWRTEARKISLSG